VGLKTLDRKNQMSVSFSQPVRVYKFNNSTNDGTIAPDNAGALRASQQQYITNPIAGTTSGATVLTTADIGTTTAVPFVLPAGAIIEGIALYQDVAATGLTGGVITVSIGQPDPTTGVVTTTAIGTITPTAAGGRIVGVFTATAATAAILGNIGLVDATLTFSAATVSANTGTLGGTISVDYTARNYTGSIVNVGQGYTNS
jgi:hypothetical protein